MHLGIHYRSGMCQHEGERVSGENDSSGDKNSELQDG